MNLLLFEPSELNEDRRLVVSDRRAEHLIKVLKVSVGTQLRVGQVGGMIGLGDVLAVEPGRVVLEVKLKFAGTVVAPTTLVVALPRPQLLKKVLQVAAMVGVSEVVLTRSARVEKSFFQSPLLEEGSIHREFLNGLEQGVATALPAVRIFRRFKECIAYLVQRSQPIKLLAEPSAPRSLAELYLEHKLAPAGELIVAVGPEGGWQGFEIEALKDIGFIDFSLGCRILRVDVAVSSLLGQIGFLRALIHDRQ